MLTKRTIIGIVVGTVIVAVGVASFIDSLGLQTVTINDTYTIGGGETYALKAPAGAMHELTVTGESFEVELSSPPGGLQIPPTNYRSEFALNLLHEADGETQLRVKNQGASDLNVSGTVQISSDPIYMTYHILVVISGIVIIGFSAGFSIRKPRGF